MTCSYCDSWAAEDKVVTSTVTCIGLVALLYGICCAQSEQAEDLCSWGDVATGTF